MSDMNRRSFLTRGWKFGVGLLGVAGLWTSWDVLRPLMTAGLGGIIKTVPPSDVPDNSAVFVRAAQSYLTRIDDEIVALHQRCPHLGCRVAWCESSGEFECACHGSSFNRAGEVRGGPAPRGMDRFVVSQSEDLVEVDTGTIIPGATAGTAETIDEPRRGEGCGHA